VATMNTGTKGGKGMNKICLIGYTVEELNGLDIARLQGLGTTPASAPVMIDVNGSGAAFPQVVAAVLDQAEARKPFLTAFTKDVATWPNVVLAAREKGKYLRFDKAGSPAGSFTYLRPGGTVNFRLTALPLGSDFPDAFLRKVQADNPRKVAIVVWDASTLRQAIALAKLAYDAA